MANDEQDRHEIRELQGGDVFCGVFDGHGGWQVRFACFVCVYYLDMHASVHA